MNLSCDLEGNGAVLLTLPHTYRVTANSGVGGTVVPGGASMVAANGTHQLTIVPAPNYVIDTLIDNGVDKTNAVSANLYTVTGVTEDHVIDITFKTTGGADKSKLRAAIVFADTLETSAYTSASWAALTSALTSAKTVNGTVGASQDQVDTACVRLNSAITALEEQE